MIGRPFIITGQTAEESDLTEPRRGVMPSAFMRMKYRKNLRRLRAARMNFYFGFITCPGTIK